MINDKIRGSLIGGAIGDSLGYQIEFERDIHDKQVTTFNRIPALISDDTQMTLFTANAIIYNETNNYVSNVLNNANESIFLSYLDWLETQNAQERCKNTIKSISWLKYVSGLQFPRMPGNSCVSALMSKTMGTTIKPINDSKGCGGLMRVAPIGLYYKDIEIAGKLAVDSSAITHGNPLGFLPSYVLVVIINLLLYRELSLEDAIKYSIEKLKSNYKEYNKDIEYLVSLIDKAIQLSKSDMKDTEAIKLIGEGWVAEETLAIALYSCLKYDNFTDAIICSINHDGDSDSTGSVAGNIMGLIVGYENIDSYYKESIELSNIILEVADDLSKTITDELIKEEIWKAKYIKTK